MKIFRDFDQRSPDWYKARLGIPTTSEFVNVLRTKGRGEDGKSVTREAYMAQLATERLTGRMTEGYSNHHMRRGQENESEWRPLYAMMKNTPVEQVAFIRTSFENGDCGCSPDGLVANDGMVEGKDCLPHIQIKRLRKNVLPPEHEPQCMGALLVSQREWIDFVSHCEGLPLFVHRVYRDERRIAEIKLGVERFNYELQELVAEIERMRAA